MVPRIEEFQTSTIVDNDEDLHHEVRSLLDYHHGHIVKIPPTHSTQLEDVTNSLDLGVPPNADFNER